MNVKDTEQMGLTNKAKEEWGDLSHGGITCFWVLFFFSGNNPGWKHKEPVCSVTMKCLINDLWCSLRHFEISLSHYGPGTNQTCNKLKKSLVWNKFDVLKCATNERPTATFSLKEGLLLRTLPRWTASTYLESNHVKSKRNKSLWSLILSSSLTSNE